jgi:hypothetical protein
MSYGDNYVCAERRVDASAEIVYGYLVDMREHHHRRLDIHLGINPSELTS